MLNIPVYNHQDLTPTSWRWKTLKTLKTLTASWIITANENTNIVQGLPDYDFAKRINDVLSSKSEQITINDLSLWNISRAQEFVDWINSDKKNFKWYAENFWEFDLSKWLIIEDEKKISDEEKAQSTAEALSWMFDRLSKSWEEIDIMRDEEWRKLILDLVRWEKNPREVFDTYLRQALSQHELSFSRPSYDYFLQENPPSTVGFTLRVYWNRLKELQEKEIQRLTQKAQSTAQSLSWIFDRLSKSWEGIDIMRDEEWRKLILDLVRWEKNPREVFDTYLRQALSQHELSFSRPSYDYFLQENPPSTVGFTLIKTK